MKIAFLRCLSALLLSSLLILVCASCSAIQDIRDAYGEVVSALNEATTSHEAPFVDEPTASDQTTQEKTIDENGSYTTKEDVALYISTYGRLPSNFITKKQAQDLGWSGGSLEKYAPGKCIGGDYFGNYEELLPVKEGRSYTECDIDTLGAKSRGEKRIVFSNDGLIFYTDDHYESFTQLK